MGTLHVYDTVTEAWDNAHTEQVFCRTSNAISAPPPPPLPNKNLSNLKKKKRQQEQKQIEYSNSSVDNETCKTLFMFLAGLT